MWHGRGRAAFLARPTPAWAAARALLCLCHRPVSPALAAGATWRLVIASAPWAARNHHTSAIDAAGAIYVIGGESYNGVYYNDVWVSTDGGAWTRPGGRWVGTQGVLRGYREGTQMCQGAP
jgi:hypothetical protein